MSCDADRFGILFVCTANACRSVIAERAAIPGLRTRLGSSAARFHVASAGTAGLEGYPLHPCTAAALSQLGVSTESFASHALTLSDIDRADLILTAGREHRDQVIAMRPGVSRRVYLLREFARLAVCTPAPGTHEDPVDRARSLVAEVARQRGRVPYVDPAEDEIADPAATRAAFASCARVINGAVLVVLDALCGAPVADGRPPAGPGSAHSADGDRFPATGGRTWRRALRFSIPPLSAPPP